MCVSVLVKNVDNCVVCLKLPGFCWHRLDVVFYNERKIPHWIGAAIDRARAIINLYAKSAGKSDTFHVGKKYFKSNAQYSSARRLTAVKRENIGNCNKNNERPVQRRVFSNIIAIIDLF